MLYSINKLKEMTDNCLEDKYIYDQFIQLGHEVEEIEVIGGSGYVVGQVVEVEKHPDADTLNVTKVNLGQEIVQIVCGAKNVTKGMKVIVATPGTTVGNLTIKPVKLRGLESNGMLCALDEICFDNKLINPKNEDFIFEFDFDVEVGMDALSVLNLKDQIYDISLTANRGDCLSYFGMARDLMPLFNKTLKTQIADIINSDKLKVNIESGVTKLNFVEFSNVNVVESPSWLKIFLAKHGVANQNLFVDMGNYLMLVYGIPMHCYDADKIEGGIKVTTSSKEQTFVGLDGNEYNVLIGDLIIEDDKKLISLPSVMGSDETKVTEDTSRVYLEVGSFDAVLVRKTSTSKKLKTDASMRGEKGTDSEMINYVTNKFLQMIKDITSIQGEVVFSNEYKSNEIVFKLQEELAKTILGVSIDFNRQKEILINLGFDVTDINESMIQVKIPSHRFDMENDHDFIEEFIRIEGLEMIEVTSSLDTFINNDKKINNSQIKITNAIEDILLRTRSNNVITYSLISEDEMKLFNQDIQRGVSLMMPMSKLHHYYRQSLLPSLVEVAKYNLDRQANSINIFEVGNVYYDDNNVISESFKVAGVLGGVKHYNNKEDAIMYDFYDAKFMVESILGEFDVDYKIIPSNDVSELNPFAQGTIIVNDKEVGCIGLKHLNYMKKIKVDLFMFEIDLQILKDIENQIHEYVKINPLPSVNRQLTINVDENLIYSDIITIFDDVKYLDKFRLVNIYNGENIKEGLTSYSFSLSFTSDESLTGEKIDTSIEGIINKIEEKGYIFNK